MSEIAERLINVAADAIEERCIHTDPVEDGCECVVQARDAVVAVLRELARPMQVGGTGVLPMEPVWYPVPLSNLADEIEGQQE